MKLFFKLESYFYALYMFLIAVVVGALVACGAFSAPSIFRAASIVEGLDISILQSGILMTSIFVKLNVLLNIVAIFIIIYEILTLRINRDVFAPILGFISVILIFLFTMYYTPYMLESQLLGEDGIANSAFDNIHNQSVLVFKSLMATLSILFIYRILKRQA